MRSSIQSSFLVLIALPAFFPICEAQQSTPDLDDPVAGSESVRVPIELQIDEDPRSTPNRSVLKIEAPEAASSNDTMVWVGQNQDGYDELSRKLRTQTSIVAFDESLEDVLSRIEDAHDLKVQIDSAALTTAGVAPTDSVTIFIHNVSLETGLRNVLSQLDLTLVYAGGLRVTTIDQSLIHPMARVYWVDGLGVESKVLAEMITKTVMPESWESGDVASIYPSVHTIGNRISQRLTVVGSFQVHRKIEELLAAHRGETWTLPERKSEVASDSSAIPQPELPVPELE